MGGKSSKGYAAGRYSSYGSSSDSWGNQAYPQYTEPNYSHTPAAGRYSSYGSSSHSWGNQAYPRYAEPSYAHTPPPPNQSSDVQASESRRRLERKFSKINDEYHSLEQVT